MGQAFYSALYIHYISKHSQIPYKTVLLFPVLPRKEIRPQKVTLQLSTKLGFKSKFKWLQNLWSFLKSRSCKAMSIYARTRRKQNWPGGVTVWGRAWGCCTAGVSRDAYWVSRTSKCELIVLWVRDHKERFYLVSIS